MGTLSDYQKIKNQIKDQALLVAVSKKQPLEKVIELYKQGQRDFGENYVQEMVSRAEELSHKGYSDIRWHFMGHLQKNKVKVLLPFLYMLHSLDSLALANEIQKRAQQLSIKDPIKCTLQINIDEEESKSGVRLDEVKELYSEILKLDRLALVGLMCIPKVDHSEKAFQKMKSLSEEMNKEFGRVLLSMGMSADYETALKYDSDFLRLGTILFGPRTS